MRFHLFSLLFFTLFASILAKRTTTNYDQAYDAAKDAGVTIKEGPRYAYLEYWTTSRFSSFPNIPDCITGWKHIRLIVGEVVVHGRRSRDPEYDFEATAWDLVVDSTDAGKLYQGGKTDWTSQGWAARSRNSLVYYGKVDRSDRTIARYADEFIEKYPSYSMATTANCRGFAYWMFEQIKQK